MLVLGPPEACTFKSDSPVQKPFTLLPLSTEQSTLTKRKLWKLSSEALLLLLLSYWPPY